ncbi:hypothetical protein FGO68_gene17222 [Halteria grandinella]|uniref:Uncharacterized protein n=1 Tax=Halteria grandinella TaxID=5974 RepID=A0A8J8P0L5_HALGN|nr:hypothetical protein FGO68_gene17222 [Halteria grandinella]
MGRSFVWMTSMPLRYICTYSSPRRVSAQLRYLWPSLLGFKWIERSKSSLALSISPREMSSSEQPSRITVSLGNLCSPS